MLFTLTLPDSYITNISFHWKDGTVRAGRRQPPLPARRSTSPGKSAEGKDAGAWAKTMAASSIGLWIGVMYFGRMLPFIGNSF
jgi:hypothetical protein